MGYYLLLSLVSVTSFAVGLWIGLRGRRRAIAGFVTLLVLLLCKAVLNHNPDWEFALFPWPDYIYFQSYLMFPLAPLNPRTSRLQSLGSLLPQRGDGRCIPLVHGLHTPDRLLPSQLGLLVGLGTESVRLELQGALLGTFPEIDRDKPYKESPRET